MNSKVRALHIKMRMYFWTQVLLNPANAPELYELRSSIRASKRAYFTKSSHHFYWFLKITAICQQSFVKRHSIQFRDNPLSFSRVTPNQTDACKFRGALLRFLVANAPEVPGRLPFPSTCCLPLCLQVSLHQQKVLPLRLIKSSGHTIRVLSTWFWSSWSHYIPC